MDIGQAVVAALVLVGQPLVIQTQGIEECGVQVVNVPAVGDSVKADIIRFTNRTWVARFSADV